MLLWALAALVLARLVSLALYPLMDTTEARYGDIARRMVERSDWITPWFTDDQPFWGKPPLSFWATAIGFKLFGINEFGGRLPHLFLGFLVGTLTWLYARRQSARAAWHAVALLSASLLFIVSSGAVMTDMSLVLGTTLVMVGFGAAMRGQSGRTWPWQLLMALGFTIGMLAKGPLALVLCGMPIGIWLIWQRRLIDSWRRIAWLRIGLLALVLSLPWYVLAELHSPGFLNYFIVGEHWHRFVTSGWAGDKYGSAHAYQRGGIWLLAFGALLPWPFLLVPLAIVRSTQKALLYSGQVNDGERSYLLLWGLWPCVFFTLSGNILWTYVLPGLPALAIFVALWTAKQAGKSTEWVLTGGVWICTVTLAVCVALANSGDYSNRKSAKSLVMDYQALAQTGEPLFYWGEVPFSASFYSGGRAQQLSDLANLASKQSGTSALVVMSLEQQAALLEGTKARFEAVSRRGSMLLLRWR
jgi:4-amino-4-deoxy-L-arabinose transferase-like glycosyltransferase